MPFKRRRGFLFYLVSFALSTILFLFFAEVGARILGFRPWRVQQADIKVEPGGRFFRAHPTLGYTHLPGEFKVTLNGSYVFRATNMDNTLRITHPPVTYNQGGAKREIWILGDSVTYGWSVSDEESYPWLLQESFPQYEVVNFGVSGYGLVHSLIQLREALQNHTPPKLVIVAYASWMDVRNTFIRARRKMVITSNHLGPLNQPYARLSQDNKLEIFMDTTEYKEFPLMRYSALIHAIEESYNRYEERYARSHEVTKAIIKEIIDLCRAHGIELVLASLTSDDTTLETREYCRKEGIKVVDIYVDLNVKGNNNLPFDSHPSAVAHRQYAQKLKSFLNAFVSE